MSLLAVILASALPLIGPDGPLESSGWTLGHAQPKDAFRVKDGVLELACTTVGVNEGLSYVREVPLYGCGEFSFEILLDSSAVSQNDLNLWINVGAYALSFRQDGLERYYPFAQPKWQGVCLHRFPAREWVRFRMVWNNDLKVIKYYCGDMRVPTKVERGNAIGPFPNSPMRLGFRNYGRLQADYTDRIRNLVYREIAWRDEADAERDSLIVFRGLTDEEFPIDKWSKGFDREHTYDFVMDFVGSNIGTLNRMTLDSQPDEGTLARAKRILLVDMPLADRVFPETLQAQLMAAVADGAELVVTDGPLALEKCGNYESPIAKALPVKLVDPWTPVKSARIVRKDHGKGKIIVVNRRGFLSR